MELFAIFGMINATLKKWSFVKLQGNLFGLLKLEC